MTESLPLQSSHSLIVAFDHATLGLLPGLERIEHLATQLDNHPVGGMIMHYGVLKRLSKRAMPLRADPIVRLDGNQTFLAGDWTKKAEWELLYRIDDCQQLGARAAIVNLLLGGPAELASIKVVAQAAGTCQQANLPLFVSAICLCERRPDDQSHSCQAFSARVAYELGADCVNIYGAQDASVVKEVRQWCPLPLYAQGAATSSSSDQLRNWAASCVASGAQGVVVGRAVWQSENPIRVASELIEALRSDSN